MEKCDIGKIHNICCHKTGFSRKQYFIQLKDIPCYHEKFYCKYFERKSVAIFLEYRKESKKSAVKA